VGSVTSAASAKPMGRLKRFGLSGAILVFEPFE
jgi:hypothetical protein